MKKLVFILATLAMIVARNKGKKVEVATVNEKFAEFVELATLHSNGLENFYNEVLAPITRAGRTFDVKSITEEELMQLVATATEKAFENNP